MRSVLAGLLGCLMAGAFAVNAAYAETACPEGQIVAGGPCVSTEEVAQRIDAIVRDAMVQHDLKAVLVGFAFDDETPTLEAWGESMTGVPATPDMHFRNGAVAIAYIGTVLLQLHDDGVLQVDDTLSNWFPDYPNADQVTLTMLINGTSGYADYVTDDGFIQSAYADPFRDWQPEELIAIGLARPAVCDPGTCWAYAHTNFVILGKVLEKASGRPLDELIRAGILEPLSLANTRSEQTARIPEPVLHAFDGERGYYEESTFWNPSWTLARGAVMTSNIADILKTASAIGTGVLVSPDSHTLALAPLTAQFEPWSEDSYYGFGFFTIHGWIAQNPSFAGYAATMAYLPPLELAIAVSVTLGEKAPVEGNLSTALLMEIAAYLAPEAPF